MFVGHDFKGTSSINCLNIKISQPVHCNCERSSLIVFLLLLLLLVRWIILQYMEITLHLARQEHLSFSVPDESYIIFLPVFVVSPFLILLSSFVPICLNNKYNLDYTLITHLCLINLIHMGV